MEPQHGGRRGRADAGAATATVVPLELLFTGLRRALSDADASNLPDLLGKLESERLRAEVRLRRLTSVRDAAPADESVADDLLTLPQVAAFLGVPEDYAYSLARQRKIPTVRLPGLDRGGRTTAGKYVRVRRSALVTWLGGHVDQVLDCADGAARTIVWNASAAASTATRGAQPLGRGARRALPPTNTVTTAMTSAVTVTAASTPARARSARAHVAEETR